MVQFKPMLAGKAPEFDKIKYPVLATPKLDGIRCIIYDGRAVSRSLKPIPNIHIREALEKLGRWAEGFDGELILPGRNFNEISSAVMSFEGRPEFIYKVFDIVGADEYRNRVSILEFLAVPAFIEKVIPSRIEDAKELYFYEGACIVGGYEGVMVRDPYGPYKFGRSTTKEGYLLKIKRFEDSEATVIGRVPMFRNTNPAFTGELGQTKRSKEQAGLVVDTNMLGALVVKDIKTGVEFEIGTGFTEADRLEDWPDGTIVKYKHQPHGRLEKPRSPVFLGRRSLLDIGGE